MKRKYFHGFAIVVVSATMAFAANAQMGPSTNPNTSPSSGPGSGSTNPASSSAPGADLGKLDTNKDGFISKAEARRDKELSKAFQSLDSNKDGKLDAAEFAAYGSGGGSMDGAKP